VNLDPVRRIADAVLYEGYILYPYRASAQKNRSRWQFGVVMSPGYAAADPSESAVTQTECVLEHSGEPSLQIVLRFLQVQRRTAAGGPDADGPDADGADADGASWDEAVEREVTVDVTALLGEGWVREFVIPGGEDREGDLIRRRERLVGAVSVRTSPVPGPWRAVRLTIRVENRTPTPSAPESRTDALPSALVAAHLIVGASGGEFISMTDPPEWAKPAVATCQNIGGWPVLADPDGRRRVILSAPIILYDNPELAEESPGELYDGTEIDEILTLRTLALSDEEKREARATDPRAAALIDRVEALDATAMERLHGTIRGLRPAGPPGTAGPPGPPGPPGPAGLEAPEAPVEFDPAVPWWDPEADASVSPDTDSVTIGGQQVARGSLVRLRPGARRADAQDMFLIGRTAEVQAVLLDIEDQPYLAVSLVDQPDPDLSIAHGRFLYFMPDEVEPCEATS
jgi:hypothetical protein